MRSVLRLTVVGVIAALALAPASAHASPRVTPVSGPSPFASCSTPAHSDSVTLNTESSPVVAANTSDRRNLVAVWEQDNWSSKGANGAVAGYSFNGGRTWARITLPFSTCASGGGGYGRAIAPYVAFGGDGTAYAVAMSFAGVGAYPRAIEAATSTDGGRTWSSLRSLASYDSGGTVISVVGDPVRSGTAYVAWQHPTTGADGATHVLGYFSRTTDRGRTWSIPTQISGSSSEDAYNNRLLMDRRTGRLYVTFYSCLGEDCRIAYRTSTDFGATWQQESVIAAATVTVPTLTQPGSGIVADTLTTPRPAISPSGAVAVAWEDNRFSGGRYNEVALSVSRDGRHWTRPHRANTKAGVTAMMPTVAFARNGTVGVTYYDVRHDDPADAPFSTDYWATTTRDGVHFTRSRHLAGPFDLLGGFGDLQNLYLGGTEGLVASGGRFVAVFQAATCQARPCVADNRTDIYTARFPVAIGRRGR